MTYNNDVHPKTAETAVQWSWTPTLEEPMGVWIQPPDYEILDGTLIGKGFNEIDYEATWPLDEGIVAGDASGPGGENRLWNEYGGVSACCLANAYEGLRRYDLPEITVWDAFQYTSYPCFDGGGEYGNPISWGPEEQYSYAIGAYRMVMGGARITGQWQNYARGGSTEGIWYFKLDPEFLTAGSPGVTWNFTQTPGWPVGGPGWAPPTGGLGISGQATQEQVAQWAANAGFSGNALAIAVAVAFAESSWVVDATHVNEDGSVDSGLWQINSVHTASGFSVTNAFDPVYNASWAYRISSGGTDWTPWTTYNSGAYLQYLGGAIEVSEDLRGGTVPTGSPQPLAQPALARSLEFESNVATVVGVKLSGHLQIIGGQTNFVGGIPLYPTVEPIVGQIRPINPNQYWVNEVEGAWSYSVHFSWLTRSQMASFPVVFSGTLPTGEKSTYKYFGDWFVENAPGLNAGPSVDLGPYVNAADNSVAVLVTAQNQIDAVIPTWSPGLPDGPFGGPLIATEEYYVLPQLAVAWTVRPPRHRWLPMVSQANGEPKRVIYEHVKSVPTDYWG